MVDDDGERARRAAGVAVAMYVDVVGGVDPIGAIDPALLARVHDLVAAGDHAAAGQRAPSLRICWDARGGCRPGGGAVGIRSRRVDFGQPLGVDGLARGLELLARRVLPQLS